MKHLLLIGLLAFSGCALTTAPGPDGKVDGVSGAINDVTSTGTSLLESVKKVLTFPVDLFLPAEATPEAPAQEVPGGQWTWIGSTLGGVVAGFLAGRLGKKRPTVNP